MDEVTVTAERLMKLKAQLQRAEDAFYAEYNRVNTVPEFQTRCGMETDYTTRMNYHQCTDAAPPVFAINGKMPAYRKQPQRAVQGRANVCLGLRANRSACYQHLFNAREPAGNSAMVGARPAVMSAEAVGAITTPRRGAGRGAAVFRVRRRMDLATCYGCGRRSIRAGCEREPDEEGEQQSPGAPQRCRPADCGRQPALPRPGVRS
jgi:hypothetical protein